MQDIYRSQYAALASGVARGAGLMMVAIVGTQLQGAPSFEFGLDYRFGSEVTVSGGSSSLDNGFLQMQPGFVDPASVGSATAYADRTYANGYVNQDAGTANPDAIGGVGQTWYWGYTDAGQVSGNTLSFQQTGGVETQVSTTSVGADADDEAAQAGISLSARFEAYELAGKRTQIRVGMRYFFESEDTLRFSNYEQLYVQNSYTLVDSYTVAGAPAAPYNGTLEGPGPIISNLPTNRARTNSAEIGRWNARNDVSLEVKQSLLDFFISHPIPLVVSESFMMGIEPSVHVYRAKAEVTRLEIMTSDNGGELQRWSTEDDNHAWLLGAGVDIYASFSVSQSMSIFAAIGYEHSFDDLNVEVGPNVVDIDPSAFRGSIGLLYAY